MQRGGANVQAFGKDVGTFVAAHKEHATLKDAVAVLRAGDGVADRNRRQVHAVVRRVARWRWSPRSRTASSR